MRAKAAIILLTALALAIAVTRAHAHGGHHGLVAKSAPAKGGDFTLQSAAGPVSLAALRGKAVTIYFSYLGCADICPTYLAALAAALKSLPPAQAAQVQPLFVTLDPERDSLQALAAYGSAFHPSIIGLSGSKEGVQAVAKSFGVLHKRVRAKGGGYDIDHSSMLAVIGRDGRLVERLPHDASVQRIADALKRVLGKPR